MCNIKNQSKETDETKPKTNPGNLTLELGQPEWDKAGWGGNKGKMIPTDYGGGLLGL